LFELYNKLAIIYVLFFRNLSNDQKFDSFFFD